MTIDYTQPRVPQRPGEPPRQRSWFARNWGWVVALGCISPVLLIGGCFAAIALTVFGSIRATDVYKDAIVRAQNDPRVVAELGKPVVVGWWVTGSISIDTSRGTADFQVPLNGSKNRGVIEVEASKDGGAWNYSILRVRVNDGPVIDLAPPLSPSPAESTDTAPPADQSEGFSSSP